MPSKGAIDEALERVAHRFGKGPKWIAKEVVEWERCNLLMECEDEQLERAVSAFVAGKESYHLDGLLAKLGKKRVSKPAGDGCPICTNGFVELAIWRGDEVTASNPRVFCIRCKCNKGRSGSDTVAAMRHADPTITEVYCAVESVNGYPQSRTLNREETGDAQRRRMREAGVPVPGSMPHMYPDLYTLAPVNAKKPAAKGANLSDIQKAMNQLRGAQ